MNNDLLIIGISTAVLRTDTYLIRNTMSGMMRKLPDYFIGIHKSTIINIHFIDALISIGCGGYELKMKDGRQMRISDSYKKEVWNN